MATGVEVALVQARAGGSMVDVAQVQVTSTVPPVATGIEVALVQVTATAPVVNYQIEVSRLEVQAIRASTLRVWDGAVIRQAHMYSWDGTAIVASNPEAHPAPVAAFTTSIASRAVTVNAAGSTGTPNNVFPYLWDWGDPAEGTTHTNGNPTTHTYTSAGTYTVKLTFTNDLGQTSIVSHSVTVT